MDLKYGKNKKIQVNFEKSNITDFNGLFLIDSFLEKTNFKNILCKSSSKLGNTNSRNIFNNRDLFKYELYSSFINHRSTTNTSITKSEKSFNLLFDKIPGKSTLNNFQNNSQIKDSYEMNEGLVNYVLQFDNLIYSNNGYITLDADAVDIETHGKQEGSTKSGYYKQTMFYGLCISIFNGLLPIYGILRSGNAGASSNLDTGLSMILSIFEQKYSKSIFSNILFRGDSGFGSGSNYDFCESKGIKYLTRFTSNNVLQNIIIIDVLKNDPNKRRYKVFEYQAKNWNKKRIIIAYNRPPDDISGKNEIQFYCTNIYGDNLEDYTDEKIQEIIEIYHQRGTSEHPFHDLKESFQSGQTNSTKFYTNAYKFLVSIFAITIYTIFKTTVLAGTKLIKGYFSTIGRFLIDIAGKIVKSGRQLILKLNKDSIKSKYFAIALKNLEKIKLQT